MWCRLGISRAIFLAAAQGIKSSGNWLDSDTMQWWWNMETVVEETLETIRVLLLNEACTTYPHNLAENC